MTRTSYLCPACGVIKLRKTLLAKLQDAMDKCGTRLFEPHIRGIPREEQRAIDERNGLLWAMNIVEAEAKACAGSACSEPAPVIVSPSLPQSKGGLKNANSDFEAALSKKGIEEHEHGQSMSFNLGLYEGARWAKSYLDAKPSLEKLMDECDKLAGKDFYPMQLFYRRGSKALLETKYPPETRGYEERVGEGKTRLEAVQNLLKKLKASVPQSGTMPISERGNREAKGD